MNIKELLQKLNEVLYNIKEETIYIYEMSQPQGKVRENIRNLSTIIAEHLVKIILYGKEESQTLHHWAHEINNWLNQCHKSKIKRSGRDTFPTQEELFKWLTDYYSNEGDMTGIRNVLEHEYTYQGHKSRNNITDKQIYESFIYILKECCIALNHLTNTDDKIQEILEKYILA